MSSRRVSVRAPVRRLAAALLLGPSITLAGCHIVHLQAIPRVLAPAPGHLVIAWRASRTVASPLAVGDSAQYMLVLDSLRDRTGTPLLDGVTAAEVRLAARPRDTVVVTLYPLSDPANRAAARAPDGPRDHRHAYPGQAITLVLARVQSLSATDSTFDGDHGIDGEIVRVGITGPGRDLALSARPETR